jgi:hypothetical protein
VAVGECFPTGHAQDHNHILVERWNGSAWTIADAVPRPAGSVASYLLGVSCISARNCVAVGSASFPHRNGSSWGGTRDLTLVERWNGAAWSIAKSPSPSPSSGLSQVACTATSNCTAVGGYGGLDNPRTPHTLIERWNGSVWSLPG